MRCLSEIFRTILWIFLDYYQIILDFLYVCQSVSQSLISLPICHFWGSTSETSGLVSVGLGSKWLTSVYVYVESSRVGFCDNNAHPSSLAFICLGLSNMGSRISCMLILKKYKWNENVQVCTEWTFSSQASKHVCLKYRLINCIPRLKFF